MIKNLRATMSDPTGPIHSSPLPPEAAGTAVAVAPISTASKSWLPSVRSWFRDLFIALFIAAVIILFFYQPVKVEGTSMMPRLTDQERIFINKFVYKVEAIRRGDVVVFW